MRSKLLSPRQSEVRVSPYPLLMLATVVIYAWMLVWVAGIVIAKGFWSTFFAITTSGVWSAYLVMEQILKNLNVL